MEYKKLVELYVKVESTSKRLEKTHLVAEFLKKTDMDYVPLIVLLMQGKVFPSYDDRKLGVATRLIIKALVTLGLTEKEIENQWKSTGDLGVTAETLVSKKKQAMLTFNVLSVLDVYETLRKLAQLEGAGTVDTKIKLISKLLNNASPLEARYIVRTLLEDLRVGIAEGTLRDSIVWAYFDSSIHINYDQENKQINPENRELYNIYVEAVQEAYDILNDFSEVAKIANVSGLPGLKGVKLKIGKPVKVMLFPKAIDIDDAFETVGRPAAIEYKYDGFRIQIHKKDGKVNLFTRRLDEVTQQFPEVVKYIHEFVKGNSFILDTEAVGFDPKTKKYLPFQSISQRIKRKYEIEKMSQEFPVEINVFDILANNDQSLLKTEFKQRREIIENMIQNTPKKIIVAKQIITDDSEQARQFYTASLADGEEGVMFKNLEGIYKPGARVGYGVKVKPVMEPLDLVIVAAEWGHGKRSAWLTSFTLACYDPENGEFLEIGKVGTGVKELEQEGEVTFKQMTELLKPLITQENGRDIKVTPQIVVEINYEEIQKSTNYSSNFALRFPRVIRIREDKPPEECSTISFIENLSLTQRSRF